MPELLARLTGNVFSLLRHEAALRERSHELYARAAGLESSYARYEKPAYLRRRARIGRPVDPASARQAPVA